MSRRTVLAGAAAIAATKANAEQPGVHIALLGDSVIDNKAYVGAGPDVAEQLGTLAPDWKVTRLALDGAIASDVRRQLKAVPSDATHLVISAGGNDALGESGILDASAQSVGEVLARLVEIQDRFRQNYVAMLDAAGGLKLPAAICTIYDPRFPDAMRRRLGALALSVLNDVITREAFSRRLTLIDLRVLFDDDKDFANPIEPSVQGGMKLARAVYRFVSQPHGDTAVIR